MCQLPAPRALGVPLLTTIVLTLPLLASAADAGPEQDAGAPESSTASDAGTEADGSADAGTASGPTLLFPAIGATDVVTNPALLMRIEGVALDSPYSTPTSVTIDGLLLRDPGGNLVAVGLLDALQPTLEPTAAPRVELSSAPLTLKANTRYEVFSRIAICESTPNSKLCSDDEYHSLGTFETGAVADHEAPSISSIRVEQGATPCLNSLPVVASDDLAPPSALRFRAQEKTWLGPTLSLASEWGWSPNSWQVEPVDPSGNRGAAVSVELFPCGSNSGFGSVALPDGPSSSSSSTTTPTASQSPPPRRHQHGCSLAAQPTRAEPSSIGVLALASLCLYRRRQRRS